MLPYVLQKNVRSFCSAKAPHIFLQKIFAYLILCGLAKDALNNQTLKFVGKN